MGVRSSKLRALTRRLPVSRLLATVALGASPAAAFWTNTVALATGTNVFQVYSVDFAGNTSAVATAMFEYRLAGPVEPHAGIGNARIGT